MMIDALFSQPGYVAAKKALDAVALRQEAISNNIANLETPGYKRLDIAPQFQAELEKACNNGNAQDIANLKPTLAQDMNSPAFSKDRNTVHLETELTQLNQNTMSHALETHLV